VLPAPEAKTGKTKTITGNTRRLMKFIKFSLYFAAAGKTDLRLFNMSPDPNRS
jgi:hypothetical protein